MRTALLVLGLVISSWAMAYSPTQGSLLDRDAIVSSTIITLARLEGLIDENNNFTGEDEL
ncbi:MAG: hypothetical protein ACLGG7_13470 [Bacteriovoracia bacterium]